MNSYIISRTSFIKGDYMSELGQKLIASMKNLKEKIKNSIIQDSYDEEEEEIEDEDLSDEDEEDVMDNELEDEDDEDDDF
jgi:hypothetical protein